MPKESCTIQELLEQIGVPFERDTNIQCMQKPGLNIDFLVTVGVNISDTPMDIITAAENSLQLKQQEQQQQQQQRQVFQNQTQLIQNRTEPVRINQRSQMTHVQQHVQRLQSQIQVNNVDNYNSRLLNSKSYAFGCKKYFEHE